MYFIYLLTEQKLYHQRKNSEYSQNPNLDTVLSIAKFLVSIAFVCICETLKSVCFCLPFLHLLYCHYSRYLNTYCGVWIKVCLLRFLFKKEWFKTQSRTERYYVMYDFQPCSIIDDSFFDTEPLGNPKFQTWNYLQQTRFAVCNASEPLMNSFISGDSCLTLFMFSCSLASGMSIFLFFSSL